MSVHLMIFSEDRDEAISEHSWDTLTRAMFGISAIVGGEEDESFPVIPRRLLMAVDRPGEAIYVQGNLPEDQYGTIVYDEH